MSHDSDRQTPGGPDRQQDARTSPAGAGTAPLEERDAEPRKRHGDALQDGTGNRHGVDDRAERPAT